MSDKEPSGIAKLDIAQSVARGIVPEGVAPKIVVDMIKPIQVSEGRPLRRRIAELKRPFRDLNKWEK
ncbi:MAG: hypothetical protein ACD_30C00003G0009 [uncultured bacterium]|uniref:Uncharacterized protein n=3 Tax=Candidatus Daviesiibacteriota TaxID=1752718 RepID=A0A0G0EK57_9BACT|nr:MAG: hypothetical protein ACD_30C00003G0009 [uncultured bacterium]KKQ07438.1 MAG: hypothetical protein US19_C0046G0006 [Candidatus Daviesbacteria bacterium GW2011_GWB1_36_5]OGE16616.1 MAG: hypothetical protein A2858_02105 [Candidatus Daviesbacteria bacterium RIFCSPHIGHO2_01_FULL_36_37]OGE33355.1 MAG: hypothetical protein A3C99_01535 [Candidatus Daviesbacteria bacterium RIFCSPHIGHO2_02_FULL_37_9]OGE34699.1 MAG: hypothetical protein A3E66_03665 [Candidatus Daviesbacteria bacterium RIFCSPHIGHO2